MLANLAFKPIKLKALLGRHRHDRRKIKFLRDLLRKLHQDGFVFNVISFVDDEDGRYRRRQQRQYFCIGITEMPCLNHEQHHIGGGERRGDGSI